VVADLSLTFSRTGTDLEITNDPNGTSFWIDSTIYPQFTPRTTYAPDSAYVAGSKLLAATLAAASIPVVIYAQAATTAALATLKAELEAAVSQFAYTLTLVVDGTSYSWPADFSWPIWGDVDSGMVGAHIARAALTIPVNPA
jgi:hypothetical protein